MSTLVDDETRHADDDIGFAGWEERMIAAVHGHMPWEDFDGLVRQCAGVADGALPDRDGAQSWSDTVPALLDQLVDGGILIIPVGGLHFFQELVKVQKEGSQLRREGLGGVAFVPLRGEYGWKTGR